VTALPHDAQRAIGYGSSHPVTASRPARRIRTRPTVASAKVSPVLAVRQMRTRTFVAIIALVLTATLVAVLALNTLLAQGSFARYELLTRDADLVIREQALAAQVTQLENPQTLASRAHSLGMVPNASPVYINAITGEVVGEPTPAPLAGPPATLDLRGTERPVEAGPGASGPAGPGGEQPIGLRPAGGGR
jgi:hypothetical protein